MVGLVAIFMNSQFPIYNPKSCTLCLEMGVQSEKFINPNNYFTYRYHMTKEDDQTIRSKLQNPLQSTTSKLIWGINGCTYIWGLKNLVQVVDPDYVGKFRKVFEPVIPSDVDVTEREGYSVSILIV